MKITARYIQAVAESGADLVAVMERDGLMCQKCLRENAKLVAQALPHDSWRMVGSQEADIGDVCSNCWRVYTEDGWAEGKPHVTMEDCSPFFFDGECRVCGKRAGAWS